MPENRTLSLGIKDRLTIPSLFPEKSNFVWQVLIEDISAKLRIGQEEMKEISMELSKPDDKGRMFYQWDRDKEKDIEVTFTDEEAEFLKAQVERLSGADVWDHDFMILGKAIKEL